MFTLGRVMLAVSVVGVLAYAAVPVVMPFVDGGLRAVGVPGLASYLLMRGMPRVS